MLMLTRVYFIPTHVFIKGLHVKTENLQHIPVIHQTKRVNPVVVIV